MQRTAVLGKTFDSGPMVWRVVLRENFESRVSIGFFVCAIIPISVPKSACFMRDSPRHLRLKEQAAASP